LSTQVLCTDVSVNVSEHSVISIVDIIFEVQLHMITYYHDNYKACFKTFPEWYTH